MTLTKRQIRLLGLVFCMFYLLTTILLFAINSFAEESDKPYGNVFFVSDKDIFTIKEPVEYNFSFNDKDGKVSCSVNWNVETELLELKCKNIHLRIHKNGKVEKLEWKEINENEEKQYYYHYWKYNLNPAFNTYDTK